MDPNANLQEQRDLTAKMLACEHDDCNCLHDGMRLAELVEALDEWLHKGGFMPKRWR